MRPAAQAATRRIDEAQSQIRLARPGRTLDEHAAPPDFDAGRVHEAAQ